MATKKEQENLDLTNDKAVLDQVEKNNAPAVEDERIKEAMNIEADDKAVTVPSQQVRDLNTTSSLKGHNKTNAELSAEMKAAAKKFKGEKTETVSIPAVLQPKLGPIQFVSVNGISVNVPVDGEEYQIPQSHAKVLKEMIRKLK